MMKIKINIIIFIIVLFVFANEVVTTNSFLGDRKDIFFYKVEDEYIIDDDHIIKYTASVWVNYRTRWSTIYVVLKKDKTIQIYENYRRNIRQLYNYSP